MRNLTLVAAIIASSGRARPEGAVSDARRIFELTNDHSENCDVLDGSTLRDVAQALENLTGISII